LSSAGAAAGFDLCLHPTANPAAETIPGVFSNKPRARHVARQVFVVDEDVAFITSANFTEWAHQRNVEAGDVRLSHSGASCDPRRRLQSATPKLNAR
jgi:hypothetical protein